LKGAALTVSTDEDFNDAALVSSGRLDRLCVKDKCFIDKKSIDGTIG
jgi:hypothetical protein